MRAVRVVTPGEDDLAVGERYLLLKASGDAWLVRDPDTGRRRHLPADRLERVDADPLVAAAEGLSPAESGPLAAVRDERHLGLLVEIVDRHAHRADAAVDDCGDDSAVPVRTLLSETTLCESDLHGALAELEVADLIDRVETDAPGGRAYRPTETATDAVRRLRAA